MGRATIPRQMPPAPAAPSLPALGLGLDAGGTQTRWALAAADGRVLIEGQARAFSALQMADAVGEAAVADVLRSIGDAARAAGRIAQVCAGVTGFDRGSGAPLQALLARAFGVTINQVELHSDIEMACRTAFAPGEGYLLYAGTGSIAGFVDALGHYHRAGGRGVLVDDAGGGHWIAVQALRQVWRIEDEQPGAGTATPLGRLLSARLGGRDWADHRGRVYTMSRGEIGLLALAVAEAAAQGDEAARDILRRAGTELARLAQAMTGRHGPRPIALSGRVFELSPLIEQALRDALPAGTPLRRIALSAECAAALRAAHKTIHPQ